MFKILYIEDTENNRILVSRFLGRNGYKVLTAEDAEQRQTSVAGEAIEQLTADLRSGEERERHRQVRERATIVEE